jgi:phosphomannomutase / phosphoglucomutase
MIISQPNVPASIFRAYDIRGTYPETLNSDIVYLIGHALGTQALALNEKAILIARDGRLSSPELGSALQEGILATGCDVIDLGRVPTPILYFATKILSTHSGVMITGSHNPPNYNGLKIVLAGETLAEKRIQSIYDHILKGNFNKGCGQLSFYDIVDEYQNSILKTIKLNKKLKIVVDCGNGVTGEIAPQLLKKLGCEVIELFCEIDGHFPNHYPDPSQPENNQALIKAVQLHQADLGLMFDGDGDRLGVVSSQGEIIWPDRQMILFAKQVLNQTPEATIIFDVKCTRHLEQSILALGGKPLMWRTGHSFIKAKIQEIQAPLAGEMSGHIFFNDRWYGFDDGIYTAARLLEILGRETKTPQEIFSELPNSFNTPELRIPIAESEKFILMERIINQAEFNSVNTPALKIDKIDGLRVEFNQGWGLIRASNTSPYLIARFEGDTAEELLNIQHCFRSVLLKIAPELALPF